MTVLNLKLRVLAPLTIVSTLVLLVFVLGVGRQANEHIKSEFEQDVVVLGEYYQAALQGRADKLTAALELIVDNGGFRADLRKRDRVALLSHARTLFRRLKSKHEISHFYFHGPGRINILRVHQPARHGDTIARFTLLAAEKSGAISSGVELGPLGTFTLRVVAPVFEGDVLVGYIELGEDIDHVMEDMASVLGLGLVVAVDKSGLRRRDWEDGMRMLGHEWDWETFDDVVVISRTLSLPKDLLKRLLTPETEGQQRHLSELRIQDSRYWTDRVTLRDVAGHEVGRMLVLKDVTALIRDNRLTMLLFVFGALLLGALLFMFIYWLLGRTERQLESTQLEIVSSERRLANAQRMAQLGGWDWDVTTDTLNCSDEAARILGLDRDGCPGRFNDLLQYVHPQDRGMFERLIGDLLAGDGGIRELVHRLLRQDGSRRTVHHRVEMAKGEEGGDGKIVNASMHDITERRQAEAQAIRLGRILDHSWNEIYTFDADTLLFTDVSDGAKRNLGYSMRELEKLTPVDVKPEFNMSQFAALLQPLRMGEESQITFETVHQRKDGSRYPVEVRLQLSSTETPPSFIAIVQDISERKQYMAELEHKALYDSLTELPYRLLLVDRLRHALNVARRDASPLAVFVVDIVRLREINDLLGHESGDLVLKEVALRLRKSLRDSDTIARLSGDEFAVVFPVNASEDAPVVAAKIQALFEQPIVIGDTPLEIEGAIGISFYPEHGDEPEILLQHADIAMRVAKSEMGGFSVYNPVDDPYSLRRLRLHGELRQAIAKREIVLYYQPKIDIQSGKVISVEALARWPHPMDGMISPADFIPMVEQSGLIGAFTRWALQESVEQIQRWRENGINISIAVNLSVRNLLDPGLPEWMKTLLDHYDVDPGCLSLEITESAVMSRPEQALKILEQLSEMGCLISIDDFGTGYSSLGYLKKLPVHELKIDQSFVFGLIDNDNDAVIVRSTIDLARNLGLRSVAEGVESLAVLNMLESLGCDIAQGYYISRPLPASELERWLRGSPWSFA